MRKYGMKHRPFSIGCQPKSGLVEVLDKSVIGKSSRYYNVLIYDRELSAEEITLFELEPMEEPEVWEDQEHFFD